MPDCTWLAATRGVEPPTEPAVCTRSIGLPVAPMASASASSGIMTPSKRSGALPTTTASMSAQSTSASAIALSTASRTSPAMETSVRLDRWWVCPVPRTAACCLVTLPPVICGPLASGRLYERWVMMPSCSFQNCDEVLLQCRPTGGVGECTVGFAVGDPGGGLTDAGQFCGEHRVAGERPAGGVDPYSFVEPHRLAQYQFLVGERCV